MRFNFKKIAAIGTSLLLTGMSMGLAAATSYPNGFSASNTAIVYGASAQATDLTEAQSIQTSLGTSGIVANLTGAIPLDHGLSSKIYLNTSLTTGGSLYTKSDLPTVLADGTFSGSPSSTYTQQITFIAGTNAGGDNSGNVEFSRQPTSSYDPSVGVSMGSSASTAMYNATVNFNTAVNFTSTNSQGKTLTLFGKSYVVSADSSDSAGLILFQSAQTVTLTQGGTSAAGSDTATVPVNGISHTIKLLNAGTTSATISVDGTSQSINSGSSTQVIPGVSIAVTSIQSSTAGGNTAVVLVGSNKLTFRNGQQVTQGDNNKAILGTFAYLNSVNATTSLTVAVYGQDYHTWWIGNGQSFVDPVFGSFGVSNSGLNSEMADPARDALKIGTSGVSTLTLSMTDHNNNKATFDWATNKTGNWNLSTSTGYSIYPYEMANLSTNAYTLTGTGSNNQNNGVLLQLTSVYNDTSTSSGDSVTFSDPISGLQFPTTITGEGTATLNVYGRAYTVTYHAIPGGSTGYAQIKFPTTDSAATSGFVLYPTILGQNGESVQLYAPLNLSMHAFDGTNDVGTLYLPNGNGYSSITVAAGATGNNATAGNWTLTGGTGVTVSGAQLYSGTYAGLNNAVNVSFGQMRYTLKGDTTTNYTIFKMWMPGKGLVSEPALVVYEGKDSANVYNAVLIDAKTAPAGTSSDGAGLAGVYFTSTTGYPTNGGTSGVQLYSNSNLQQYVDGYGTFVQKDATTAAQPVATVFYSAMQAYEQLYLGAVGTSSTVSGAIPLRDSDVTTGMTKNLIVVGGSCVNTVAAQLLGVPAGTCGNAWTSATTPFVTGGLGSGQFLIKSYAGANTNGLTSGTALLVAGTDFTDTINAATYLVNVKPDVAAGKAWTGTSVSSATQVLTSA